MRDVKDYPPYLDYPKPRKKQTNADRIRAMNDEELLDLFRPGVTSCPSCPADAFCDQNYTHYADITVKCRDVISAWLKQEVTDNA